MKPAAWRVVGAQIRVTGDTEENLASMLGAIAESDGNVVCFPETGLVSDEGHVPDIAAKVAAIQEAARRRGCNVIFGTYELEHNRVKNRVYVLDRTGRIVLRYDKRRLYPTEKHVTPGEEPGLCTLDGVGCAILTCWEYAHPDLVLEARGVDVIFCPSYLVSHPETAAVLERVPQVRAFDAMAFFVMVDAIAEDSYGVGRICHPLRELACKKGEGRFTASLHFDELAPIRQRFGSGRGAPPRREQS